MHAPLLILPCADRRHTLPPLELLPRLQKRTRRRGQQPTLLQQVPQRQTDRDCWNQSRASLQALPAPTGRKGGTSAQQHVCPARPRSHRAGPRQCCQQLLF